MDCKIAISLKAKSINPHMAAVNFIDKCRNSECNAFPISERVFASADHQYSLAAWIASYQNNLIEMGSTLLFFDFHSDLGISRAPIPKSLFSKKMDLSLTKEALNWLRPYSSSVPEKDFITPAFAAGLISKYILIDFTSEKNLITEDKLVLSFVKVNYSQEMLLLGLESIDKDQNITEKPGTSYVKIPNFVSYMPNPSEAKVWMRKVGLLPHMEKKLIADVDCDIFKWRIYDDYNYCLNNFYKNTFSMGQVNCNLSSNDFYKDAFSMGQVIKMTDPDILNFALSPEYCWFKYEDYVAIVQGILEGILS